MTATFDVKAKWDEEAKVYYSETNVPGLNIEADTLKDFLEMAETSRRRCWRRTCPREATAK